MKLRTTLGPGRVLPLLLCLSLFAFPSIASAWQGVFLSNNAAQLQATYIVRFETKIWGRIDKISMTFPPGTDASKAVLGRIMVNDKVTEDDGKGSDDHKLLVDSMNPNILLVDLRQSRRVWRGSILLIELFNLINPPAGDYSLTVTIQDRWGHAKETISPIGFSILAGAGGGGISAVNAGTGLTGGGTGGDVTLGLLGSFQLPQSCANGQVAKWNSPLGMWTCAADDMTSSGGDITGVRTAIGSGLTGGQESGDVTLGVAEGGITSAMIQDGAVGAADLANAAVTMDKLGANAVDSGKILDGSIGAADVNSAHVQLRVAGSCPANEAIRVVNPDGTVTCQSISGAGGGVTEVTASAPLMSSGGTSPNISLPHVTLSQCDASVSNCNTIMGVGAFASNTAGTFNTGLGSSALASNQGGVNNVAIGSVALARNTGGSNNTSVGVESLSFNAGGNANTALGSSALRGNDSGSNNVALGAAALNGNFQGSNNIAIGFNAGSAIELGNDNILVGNTGESDVSNTIRIGTLGTHTRTFIAGIRGATTGLGDAINVVIDSNGQLGTVSSSRRYKEDIRDMGEASSDLLRLRPVTFRYKQAAVTGQQRREFGLIAEEVAEISPDLVVHSATGEVETVQYHKLVPMLLNELQKQHRQLGKQDEEITQLKARLAALERLVPARESLAQW